MDYETLDVELSCEAIATKNCSEFFEGDTYYLNLEVEGSSSNLDDVYEISWIVPEEFDYTF